MRRLALSRHDTRSVMLQGQCDESGAECGMWNAECGMTGYSREQPCEASKVGLHNPNEPSTRAHASWPLRQHTRQHPRTPSRRSSSRDRKVCDRSAGFDSSTFEKSPALIFVVAFQIGCDGRRECVNLPARFSHFVCLALLSFQNLSRQGGTVRVGTRGRNAQPFSLSSPHAPRQRSTHHRLDPPLLRGAVGWTTHQVTSDNVMLLPKQAVSCALDVLHVLGHHHLVGAGRQWRWMTGARAWW